MIKNQIKLLALGIVTMLSYSSLMGQKSTSWNIKTVPLSTKWADSVNVGMPLPEYPRPQMVRAQWQNLNGIWSYAITDSMDVFSGKLDGKILVPFPIESALSGVKKTLLPTQALWYERMFKYRKGENLRTLLHFGAVDYKVWVFLNGKKVGAHEGGYTSFSFDITDKLIEGNNLLQVKVCDPTNQGVGPHGKQVLNPQNIYYTPSSGIWQTVWLEDVPQYYISGLLVTPDLDNSSVKIVVSSATDDSMEVVVHKKHRLISRVRGEANSTIVLPINSPIEWSPEAPFLYDLTIRLIKNGKIMDSISSYFGMRKVSIDKDDNGISRIFLNNKLYFNFGVLDQGFWPDGLYTAPSDDALMFDIKAIKAMGFNTIRKHIKIEPARWYYHADRLGIIVWQDFVNPNQGLPLGAKEEYEKEVREVLVQLHNSPSISTWVVFNERWGVFDQERITKLVKAIDPSRIVNGHSGEYLYVNGQLRQSSNHPYAGSDITDVHSYPDPMDAMNLEGKARVLGEFGGVGVPVLGHQWDDLNGWGYVKKTSAELKETYEKMIDKIKLLKDSGLSGCIYTQPFDVEGEENGLITYDRKLIKIPLSYLRTINKKIYDAGHFNFDSVITIPSITKENYSEKNYKLLLTEFRNGRKDSSFLRRLTILALRLNKRSEVTVVGNAYVESLICPLSKDNLLFLKEISRTSDDLGYKLFLEHRAIVNNILGRRTVENKVKEIINLEEVAPYMVNDSLLSKDWNVIQKDVKERFGDEGEEYILGRRMLYYWTVTQEWDKLGKYYMLYFKRALDHSDYNINNVSWTIFEHVNDKEVLSFAANVCSKNVMNFDNTPDAYDTYANLLFKIGRKKEAIDYERKAFEMSNKQRIYGETLAKMEDEYNKTSKQD